MSARRTPSKKPSTDTKSVNFSNPILVQFPDPTDTRRSATETKTLWPLPPGGVREVRHEDRDTGGAISPE